jgi:hypothetical protein
MGKQIGSREFRLVAACCRWPASTERDQAVRAAALDVDWPRFHRLVALHRVEGLAYAALTSAKAPMDGDASEGLAATAAHIARQGLLLAAEAVRLQRGLDAAGLANLILKGPALEMLAYGRLGLKRAWDLDLLVAPRDAVRARASLEDMGYDLVDPIAPTAASFEQWIGLSKECVLVHRVSGQPVELHWRPVDGSLLPGLCATSPTQVVKIGPATELRTLAVDELFAYLTVHGTSHGWARLKFLADLNALLAGQDEASIERLCRRAKDLGAGICPEVALQLRQRLFDRPPPAAISRSVERNPKAAWLEAIALSAMEGEREVVDRPMTSELIRLSQILFGDGWAFRWREIRRQWVSVQDRRRIRLPPQFAFVYDLIRVPLWLWRQIYTRARVGHAGH